MHCRQKKHVWQQRAGDTNWARDDNSRDSERTQSSQHHNYEMQIQEQAEESQDSAITEEFAVARHSTDKSSQEHFEEDGVTLSVKITATWRLSSVAWAKFVRICTGFQYQPFQWLTLKQSTLRTRLLRVPVLKRPSPLDGCRVTEKTVVVRSATLR